MTVNMFNCENVKVTIPGKVKSFMLSRCKGIELSIDACVSKGEMIRCERVQLRINISVPYVSVELSKNIEVHASAQSKHNIQIMTTASQ